MQTGYAVVAFTAFFWTMLLDIHFYDILQCLNGLFEVPPRKRSSSEEQISSHSELFLLPLRTFFTQSALYTWSAHPVCILYSVSILYPVYMPSAFYTDRFRIPLHIFLAVLAVFYIECSVLKCSLFGSFPSFWFLWVPAMLTEEWHLLAKEHCLLVCCVPITFFSLINLLSNST